MKKVLFSLLILFVLFIFAMFILFLTAKPEDRMIPTGARDENGNIIIVEDIPYFCYIEKAFWDEDPEEIKRFDNRIYQSKEYEEYFISDYKDGVCINRYRGKDKNLIIPETIDGKKVVKLGSYHSPDIMDGYYATPALSSAFEKVDYSSIRIPSGVKEITADTFTSLLPELEEIVVDEQNPYYYSKNGDMYSKETGDLLVSPRTGYCVGKYTLEGINK